MLASPLQPAVPFGKSQSEKVHSYRPTKDCEAFRALVPPVEFVEGSSTGAVAILDSKYVPINGTPKKRARSRSPPPTVPTPITPSHPSRPSLESTTPLQGSGKGKQLYTGSLETSWLPNLSVGAGLHNTGNTCFLNSALQCLLHTPPLLRVLLQHTKSDPCRAKGNCITCALREVAYKAHAGQNAFTPSPILAKLQVIAKHMRRGRQEDSHEFLRYLIDGMQKSCLVGQPPKLDPKIAETTWVHKIFGGKLRSQVRCRDCGHKSDTFDSILDLSVDIHQVDGLREALKKFTHIDVLKGADKYKCEKCKKPVVAEKQFTIHDAPLVLTVHLKRFSPLGRKIGHAVQYPDTLSLAPYMSAGQYGPTYSLYGVVSHAGSGPNSGHYYSHVRGGDNRWYNANDDMISPVPRAPLQLKTAYMLFYIREKGQALEAAVAAGNASNVATSSPSKAAPSMLPRTVGQPSKVSQMKAKRRIDSDDEEVPAPASPAKRQAIGPLLSNGQFIAPKQDPQAKALSQKIAAAQAAKARPTAQLISPRKLVDYEDDADSSDIGEPVTTEPSIDNSLPLEPVQAELSSPPADDTVIVAKVPGPKPALVAPASFYGADKKRKPSELDAEPTKPGGDDEDISSDSATPPTRSQSSPVRPQPAAKRQQLSNGDHKRRSSKYSTASPYERMRGSNNLHEKRDHRDFAVGRQHGHQQKYRASWRGRR